MTERERTYAVQLTVNEAYALKVMAGYGLAAAFEEGHRTRWDAFESAMTKLAAFERRFTPRAERLSSVPGPADSPPGKDRQVGM